MNKLKLMTILGTRPEIIKLSAVLKLADQVFDHTIVHTGQNWDFTLNEVFFNDLNLRKPDYCLDVVENGLGDTIGNIISKSYRLISELNPDAVLILGDTNSALSAISAKRLKVPIFHMEAGNRCFDENLPEEINRKIVDHIADINLPYTEHARRNLISEGLKKEFTFVTGSPMAEVIKNTLPSILNSEILNSLNLKKKGYLLLSAHREENIDIEKNFLELMNAVNHVAEKYDIPIIYSTHPRAQNILNRRKFSLHPLVKNLKPFGYFDYNQLQMNALCVLSDSGTLAEESSLLGFPAVSLRTSTERPEVMDKGSMIIGGITSKDVEQAIEFSKATSGNFEVFRAKDYIDTNVSLKVVNIIQSYTKIVNKVTWKKD